MVLGCFAHRVWRRRILDSCSFRQCGRSCAAAFHGNLRPTHFVHPPFSRHLLWFAVEMYMLFAFGREVERFIGRRAYLASLRPLASFAVDFLTFGVCGKRVGLAGSRVRALRNFCRLCYDLSECQKCPVAYHGKMGRADLARRLLRCTCLAYHVWSEMAVAVVGHAAQAFLFIRTAWDRSGISVVGRI